MSQLTITAARIIDLRFPTSREAIGSDAVNKDPDYSAAYIILETNHGLEGHGLTFTLGRGTDLCVQALRHLASFAIGRTLWSITEDFAAFSRRLTGETQFRWLGPEKGVVHLAAGALLNAIWDLYARVEGKPVWQLLAEMSSEQLVSLIDFRHITDALTPQEALALLQATEPGRDSGYADRLANLRQHGYPAYTTSIGWFGFSDEKIDRLATEALAEGWTHFKLKVGGDPQEDLRRARLVREKIGPDNKLMLDANQKWDVGEAILRTQELAELNPWWMEEPTSPDDILGHARIRQAVPNVRIATGEHCQNKVMFKQLFQAHAIDVCQIDSCRVAGINENLAIVLMAAKFGIPVCPHAGGVGLCEYVQHLSAFDYLRVSATLDDRVTEYVGHLHEHFLDPVVIRDARYVLPSKPGYSIEIFPQVLREYSYPDGPVWSQS